MVNISLVILASGAVLVALIYGQGFLVPIVIAFLVVNLMEAIIEALTRLRVPAALAYAASIFLVLAGFASIAYIISGQVDEVASAWPRYVARLEQISAGFVSWAGAEASAFVRRTVQEINLATRLPGLIGSAGGILLNLGLVLLYVAFLLPERGRFAHKLMSLAREEGKTREMRAIMTAVSQGIRRYLLVKTLLSFTTASLSYAALKYFNVDFAETWAVIIFLLNYIPSIGSVLGAVLPSLIALVQFDTFDTFLSILLLLSIIQFTIGNIVEPSLLGRSLNLSPFVVILLLVFWSTIWGVAGAFLSIPISVAFLIICQHVPEWRWLAVLLTNQPVGDGNNGERQTD